MTNQVNELNEVVKEFNEDIAKFNEKGNKAAGTRARGSLARLAKLSKEIRKDIQEKKSQ